MGSRHADHVSIPNVSLCGGGSAEKPGGGTQTMKTIGPSGGAVSSSDGNLAVTIPAGALPSDPCALPQRRQTEAARILVAVLGHAWSVVGGGW